MAKTLSDLRIGVRVYLDESNQTDFLDTEVLRSINYAYQDLISEAMEAWEEFYFTTTPTNLSTVANQQEYTLSTNLLKFRRVEINYNPTTANTAPLRAKPIRIDELPQYLADPNAGGSALFACGYYIIGSQDTQKIGFVPIPTVTATNNVHVWGIQAPSDLVDDTDSVYIPYPDRFTALIELKAAADLLRKGQQAETEAARYTQEYIAGIVRMKTFLSERQGEGVRIVEDAELDDISFDFPL